MRIAVVSECHVGSAWAHAINVIKTAGGFMRLGHDVTLLCRAHPDGADPLKALKDYGEVRIGVQTAPTDIALEDAEGFVRWAASCHAFGCADMVYCRHFHAALAAADAGVPAVLETHAYTGDCNPALLSALAATARVDRSLAAIVTIHPTLREYYISAGADPKRVHVVPDGVDVEMFAPPRNLPAAPWADDEPLRPRAVYAGRLFAYKGVDTLVRAAALLPEWIIEILGGPPEEIERLTQLAASIGVSNVRFRGQRALAEVPRWLWSADALVLAPSALEPSAGWTSPVKLGEYLAAGPPIIASDIPGLRAWVDELAVRWVKPDDAQAVAAGFSAVWLETAIEHTARRVHAEKFAQQYSYVSRARAIMSAAFAIDAEGTGAPIASERLQPW